MHENKIYVIWFLPMLFCLLAAVLLAAVSSGFRADFDQLVRLAASRYGESGRQTIQDWHSLLDRLVGNNIPEQLEQVNQFVNIRVQYADDLVIWGKADYWATPLEALGRGVGDCEDSAFAKYISLLQLGVPDDQLRLTYVRARFQGQVLAHMVVSYYPAPDLEPLILDSLKGDVLPASRRSDLFPIFSFNTSSIWVGSQMSPAPRSPSDSLSNWRSVLVRMRSEGWK